MTIDYFALFCIAVAIIATINCIRINLRLDNAFEELCQSAEKLHDLNRQEAALNRILLQRLKKYEDHELMSISADDGNGIPK